MDLRATIKAIEKRMAQRDGEDDSATSYHPAARYTITKSMPKVYLAGAISGLTYGEGQSWRDHACNLLVERGLLGYSPLRAKDYLRSVGTIEQSYQIQAQPCGCLSSDRGIMTRDRYDVMTADAVLIYLLGTGSRVSVGTCIEFGWADAFRKPIVVVMEPEGNVHDHPMVREATGFRVATLEEGIEVIDRILNPQLGR